MAELRITDREVCELLRARLLELGALHVTHPGDTIAYERGTAWAVIEPRAPEDARKFRVQFLSLCGIEVKVEWVPWRERRKLPRERVAFYLDGDTGPREPCELELRLLFELLIDAEWTKRQPHLDCALVGAAGARR